MFDIAKIIEVLSENCPSEALGLFIGTYGAFIVAIITIVIVLVRAVKKTGSLKNLTDVEISELKETIKTITESASKTALDNANVSTEIKEEIKANNDVTLQFLTALGLSSGMSYTDIKNIIDKAKNVYEASKEQYDNLLTKVEEKKTAEELQAIKEKEEKVAMQEELKETLSKIKIGV